MKTRGEYTKVVYQDSKTLTQKKGICVQSFKELSLSLAPLHSKSHKVSNFA